MWDAEFTCDLLSRFRPDNAEVLDRVRVYWQTWLQTHPPSGQAADNEMTREQLEEAEEKPHEAYLMTLAETPDGSPPDNQALCERNWPRLQEAVQQ